MNCEYCGRAMSLGDNMYTCDACCSTYVMDGDKVTHKYIVSDEFYTAYQGKRTDILGDDQEKKYLALEKLLKLCPDIPVLWNRLGVVYLSLNMRPNAIKCYEHALTLNEYYTLVRMNIAIAYAMSEKFDEARKNIDIAYVKMPETDPNYAAMLGNYAYIYGKSGKMDTAKRFLEDAYAAGYKGVDSFKKMLGLPLEKKGILGNLFGSVQKCREDTAVRRAYRIEEDKRSPHVKAIRIKHPISAPDRQTLDSLEVQETQIYQSGDDFPTKIHKAAPLRDKMEEIRNRYVEIREEVIPPEIDPSIPIEVNEAEIRKRYRK